MFRTFAAVLLFSISSSAMAAGWTADRVRGEVLVEDGSGWQQVVRGLEVGDGAHLKTGISGRVDFSRGRDHFSLGANTQVQLRDAGPDLMTSVIQTTGTVSVDVERRNVQHFSVQTPFLAAVVKGTKFTVTSDRTGSHVDVDRGVVQVQDSSGDLVADVRPGQEAGVTADAPLKVDGAGAAPVYTSQGVLVSANGNRDAVSSDNAQSNSGNQKAGQEVDQIGNSGRGQGQGNGGSSGNSGNGNNGDGPGSNYGNGGGSGNGGSNGNSGNQGHGSGGGNDGSQDNGNSGNGNGNQGNSGKSDDNGNSGNGNNGNGGGNSGNGNGNGGNNGNGNGGENNGNGNGHGHGQDK